MLNTVEAQRERPPALTVIKAVHTLVWAWFAGCMVAIPIATYERRLLAATVLAGIVLCECVVLGLNQGRCPLTDLASRYTADREPNFDICLPKWLARWNKLIFGSVYVLGLAYLVIQWALTRNVPQ